MAKVELDMVFESLVSVVMMERRYSVKVKLTKAVGPAGGNPEVLITGSRKNLERMIDVEWGDPYLKEFIEE